MSLRGANADHMACGSVGRWSLPSALVALAVLCPLCWGQQNPVADCVNKLLQSGGFRVSGGGNLKQGATTLATGTFQGTYKSRTTFEVSGTYTTPTGAQEIRIIRIEERQWEWTDPQAGWRTVEAGHDPVNVSFDSIVAALSGCTNVKPAAGKDCGGVRCVGYTFVLPPGVAKVADLVIEGTGRLYVGEADGLPREIALNVVTPIGASGEATATISDIGTVTDIQPPDPGGGVPMPPPLTRDALVQVLAAQPTVYVNVTAHAEGGPSIAQLVPAPDGTAVLDVLAFHQQQRSFAKLTVGETVLFRMVATGGTVREYFAGAQGSDNGNGWHLNSAGSTTPDAAFRMDSGLLSQALDDRALKPVGEEAQGQRTLLVYSFDPGGPGRAPGLLLPYLREKLAPESLKVSGRLLVDKATGCPDTIELRAEGASPDGQPARVEETYSLQYAAPQDLMQEAQEYFEWAEEGDAEIATGEQEMKAAVARIAGECGPLMRDSLALSVKLARLQRICGASGARVVDPRGKELSHVGQFEMDAKILEGLLSEAGKLTAGDALARTMRDATVCVAPISEQGKGVTGFVVIGRPVQVEPPVTDGR